MKGQSLIEAIMAIGVVSVLITGVIFVITSSLGNANFSKNQALATQYTQEGLEILRQIRDKDYSTFAGYNNTYCLAKGVTTLVGSPVAPCTIPNVDNFIRSVKLENSGSPGQCAANVTRATVTVAWTDGKCSGGTYCHNVSSVSCISTTNPIPAL